MGLFSNLFSSGKMNIPSYSDIYSQAKDYMSSLYPLAMGAREGALSDINKGTSFYQSFQPTSLEQALANQYFANVMPDVESSIKHNLALSGMSYSPAMANLISQRRGELGVDIGEYLSNLGNARAQYSLSSRLGIDPSSMVSDYANQLYNNALAREQYNASRKGGGSILTSLLGAGLGALFALPTGGMSVPMGAALGGALGGIGGSLFGGGGSPIDLGTALSVGQLFPSTGTTTTGISKYLANPQELSILDNLSGYKSLGWDNFDADTLSYGKNMIQDMLTPSQYWNQSISAATPSMVNATKLARNKKYPSTGYGYYY